MSDPRQFHGNPHPDSREAVPSRHRARRARVIVALAVACSSQGSKARTDLAPAGLPTPAGASAVNQPTVDGATTTQSFQISGQNSKQAMAFYADQLPKAGWTPNATPGPSGTTDYAGVWTKGTQKLRVTTSPFERRTQINLQLSTN
jgi:hypothetical protein